MPFPTASRTTGCASNERRDSSVRATNSVKKGGIVSIKSVRRCYVCRRAGSYARIAPMSHAIDADTLIPIKNHASPDVGHSSGWTSSYNGRRFFSSSVSVPVNLVPPASIDLHPVTGVSIGTAMAGVRKANRRDVTVVTLSPGAASPAYSPPTDLRRARAVVPRASCGRFAGARHPRQYRERQCRDGCRRPRPGPLDVCRARLAARLRARAGAAVFHRRDHGDAAQRSHRGGAAGGARRCGARSLGASPPRRS